MKVLVIGDAITDHYVFGTINRMSPEDSSVPILDIDSEDYRLGGCLNVAANLKSLNPKFTVEVASIYCKDTAFILEAKGISHVYPSSISRDVSHVFDLIKTRYIDKSTGNQLMRVDNRKEYPKFDIDYFNHLVLDTAIYDAIVISDYNKGLINEITIEKLKLATCPVFIDTKKTDLSIWNDFNKGILKINLKEYEASTQPTKRPLIVTQGKKGAKIYNVGKVWELLEFAGPEIEDADVTGAGDVFLAGLVVDFLEFDDILEAIAFANKAARLSVQKPGTCEVYKYEF